MWSALIVCVKLPDICIYIKSSDELSINSGFFWLWLYYYNFKMLILTKYLALKHVRKQTLVRNEQFCQSGKGKLLNFWDFAKPHKSKKSMKTDKRMPWIKKKLVLNSQNIYIFSSFCNWTPCIPDSALEQWEERKQR